MIISPYKDHLVNLVEPQPTCSDLFSYAAALPSLQLTDRQRCDLEMLATGSFSPLASFMGEEDYNAVVDTMRLSDGTIFPVPVTLAVEETTGLRTGSDVALRDRNNDLLALLTVEEVYEWDRQRLAEAVFGTTDIRHPLVAEMRDWGRFNVSGRLRVLGLPTYHDFRDLRLTPAETRKRLIDRGRTNVVGFQSRNPLHRAHEEMMRKALAMTDGTLLFQPAVGMTRDGDVDYFTRVRSCRAAAAAAFPSDRVVLSLLPLAMRLAGPREAVWHAIIRRNYGANYFIVGRDHAGPGNNSNGDPFYQPSAAQALACELSGEIGVKILPFPEFAYDPQQRRYGESDPTRGRKSVSISGTEIRKKYLARGRSVPRWMMRREAAEILEAAYPSLDQQGVCIWFTGLCSSGKSTTAEIVSTLLLENGRENSLLDGDVVRTNLSKGLGFSKEDRETNIRRIGFVASEIVRHGGVAICATVSPYREVRNQVRQMFKDGNFVEVFVDAPLEICEARDSKGLYALARRGEIANFTGIGDVYEEPDAAEITLNSVDRTPHENALSVIRYLQSTGFVGEKRRRSFAKTTVEILAG